MRSSSITAVGAHLHMRASRWPSRGSNRCLNLRGTGNPLGDHSKADGHPSEIHSTPNSRGESHSCSDIRLPFPIMEGSIMPAAVPPVWLSASQAAARNSPGGCNKDFANWPPIHFGHWMRRTSTVVPRCSPQFSSTLPCESGSSCADSGSITTTSPSLAELVDIVDAQFARPTTS